MTGRQFFVRLLCPAAESSRRAARNYFPDRFAGKPIPAPLSRRRAYLLPCLLSLFLGVGLRAQERTFTVSAD